MPSTAFLIDCSSTSLALGSSRVTASLKEAGADAARAKSWETAPECTAVGEARSGRKRRVTVGKIMHKIRVPVEPRDQRSIERQIKGPTVLVRNQHEERSKRLVNFFHRSTLLLLRYRIVVQMGRRPGNKLH